MIVAVRRRPDGETMDSSLVDCAPVTTRDKLLALAEVSPGKNKKTVKSVKQKSANKSAAVASSASFDLSFTPNVEHLVTRNFRSSTPITDQSNPAVSQPGSRRDSPSKNASTHCDDSHSGPFRPSDGSLSPSDLMFQSLRISDKAHKTPSVQQHHSLSYSTGKASKFASRLPEHLNRTTSGGSSHALHAASSLAGDMFAPLNRWPETEDLSKNNSNLTRRTLDFTAALEADYRSTQYQQLTETTSNRTNVSRIPVARQTRTVSSNAGNAALQGNGAFVVAQHPRRTLQKSLTSEGFGLNAPTRATQIDYNSPSTAARVIEHNQFDPTWFPVISPNGQQHPSLPCGADYSTPPRTQPTQRQRQSTHLSSSPTSLGISTPDQSLYEKFFLRETQKNAIAHLAEQKVARSSSCESFELFQQRVLADSKFALDEPTNQLGGLAHLEEGPREEDSILNRFKKSFSLRFSRSKNDTSPSPPSPAPADSVENQSASSRTESRTEGDINQNTIYHGSSSSSGHFVRVSTVERRRSRNHDSFGRKSLRSRSRQRSYRQLKRSTSQPGSEKQAILDDGRSPSSTVETSFESTSDVESCKSPVSLNETHSTTDLNESHEDVIYAEAIWDYTKSDAEELTFQAGDLIDVTDTSNKEWWWGAVTKNGRTSYGWFPATYVRLKVSQEETIEEVLAKSVHADDAEDALKRMSVSKISSEQVRSNVVLEIINSERDFVKNLSDVIEGYLKPCRDRGEMFSPQQIQTIFGNIEQLHEFATRFLSELERCINWDSLAASEIGNCFWNNERGFSVYCDFCKNHPLATSELQDLYLDHRYIVFFEGCRLLQNMIDISLDGFLLTPIQKICKYPLQLNELLKHTRLDHPDHEPLKRALAAMQRVAQLVNDRKRRFESLEQLISLQESFENWSGLPLIDSCSLLIHSGEVSRITTGSWPKDIHLMLFDHLLILCKRDSGILKKAAYVFKARVELDQIDEVISVEDNTRDVHFNVNTKNAFKFFYKPMQKWFLFQTKTPAEKTQWLNAFAEERKRVAEDREQGFFVSEQDKRGAMLSHQNKQKPRKPRASRAVRPIKSKKPDTVIADLPLGPILDRNRAGSLPSYIHHEMNGAYKQRMSTLHKKSRSNWFQLGSSKKHASRLKRNIK